MASNCKVIVQELTKDSSATYEAVIHEIVNHFASFDFYNFSHELTGLNFEAQCSEACFIFREWSSCLVRTFRKPTSVSINIMAI